MHQPTSRDEIFCTSINRCINQRLNQHQQSINQHPCFQQPPPPIINTRSFTLYILGDKCLVCLERLSENQENCLLPSSSARFSGEVSLIHEKLYHIFRRKEKDPGRMEGLLRNEVLSFDHYLLEYMSCPLQSHH